MRLVSAVLAITVLMAFVVPAFGQEEPKSGLFPVDGNTCSWKWLYSQGAREDVGFGLGASDRSEAGYYRVEFRAGFATEKHVNQGWTTWKYTYLFMNCGEEPLIFFTVPGLGSSANEAIQDAFGRMMSALRLEAGQGVRLVFYDHRPPKKKWVMTWFMSTFDSSIGAGGSMLIPIPDPTRPKYGD